MASDLATRMWRIHSSAKRPWPVIVDDDVLDYMVMEAVGVKAMLEDEKARKDLEDKKKREEWKDEKSNLEALREG